MNLDNNSIFRDILVGYFSGCMVAAVLGVILTIEIYILSWLFKGNILRKNLDKIKDPATTGFKAWLETFVISLFSGTLMSWLGVIQYIWQIFWSPIKFLRDAISSVPEEIKALRFPLLNNPDLTKEAVFAYLNALNVAMGQRTDAWSIAEQIKEISQYHPYFNKRIALKTLGKLGAVDQETISEVLEHLGEIQSDDNPFDIAV